MNFVDCFHLPPKIDPKGVFLSITFRNMSFWPLFFNWVFLIYIPNTTPIPNDTYTMASHELMFIYNWIFYFKSVKGKQLSNNNNQHQFITLIYWSDIQTWNEIQTPIHNPNFIHTN